MVVTVRAKVLMQGLDVLRNEQGVGNAVLADCGRNILGMFASDDVNGVAGTKS